MTLEETSIYAKKYDGIFDLFRKDSFHYLQIYKDFFSFFLGLYLKKFDIFFTELDNSNKEMLFQENSFNIPSNIKYVYFLHLKCRPQQFKLNRHRDAALRVQVPEAHRRLRELFSCLCPKSC